MSHALQTHQIDAAWMVERGADTLQRIATLMTNFGMLNHLFNVSRMLR